MTHGSLSPLTAPPTTLRAGWSSSVQKLFGSHSVPDPLSDSQAKLVHYISSLSREPLFRTHTLPYLLEFDLVAFLKYVKVQNQGLFCSSHPYKCQSLFNQSNLLNRKPLIRVRPGGREWFWSDGRGKKEVRRRHLWVVLSALMDHTSADRPLPKIAHHPQPKIPSPLTEHQTPVQK